MEWCVDSLEEVLEASAGRLSVAWTEEWLDLLKRSRQQGHPGERGTCKTRHFLSEPRRPYTTGRLGERSRKRAERLVAGTVR